MATTSLWRVKEHLGRVVNYVENPEKTENEERLIGNGESEFSSLNDVIDYVSRDSATNLKQLVTGINVDPAKARDEMNLVKKKFGKEGGTIAYHGYQSFKEGEVTAEQAHQIGIDLANELWGDRFQVLVCTHVDKSSHIHNHFLLNTVSFVDGKKFFRSNDDYRQMQKVSDRLCREQHLSVVRHPEDGRGKSYKEWQDDFQGKPTYRNMIRRDIDRAIKASVTEKEFFRCLTEMGYEFKLYTASGEPLMRPSIKPKGSQRFFRFDRLGENYGVDEIKYRILENIRRELPFSEEEVQKVHRYRQEYPPRPKAKGLADLYYHYCYELHIIVRFPGSVKHVSAALREDLKKLDQLDEQVRLLGENHIETKADLDSYRVSVNEKIIDLDKMRRSLRTKLQSAVRHDDTEEKSKMQSQLAALAEERKKLKWNLVVCDRVEERAEKIAENMKDIERTTGKEKDNDELFRRRSGADRQDVVKRR